MKASDKSLGGLILSAVAIVFVYYTIWAILLVRLSYALMSVNTHDGTCSLSLIPPVPSMTGFHQGSGLCGYPRSSWSLGYQLLVYLSGQELYTRTEGDSNTLMARCISAEEHSVQCEGGELSREISVFRTVTGINRIRTLPA